jgi:hypothetical protein
MCESGCAGPVAVSAPGRKGRDLVRLGDSVYALGGLRAGATFGAPMASVERAELLPSL